MPGAPRRLALAVLVIAALFAHAGPAPAGSPPGAAARLETSTLWLVTGRGRFALTVEVARTPDQRARGLMWRRELAPDRGMLFDFDRPRPVAMWMKNTPIPLDMIFIAAGGRIVNIARATVPFSLQPIGSAGPVRAVLEVAAGTADRLALAPGDRVVHALFGNVGD